MNDSETQTFCFYCCCTIDRPAFMCSSPRCRRLDQQHRRDLRLDENRDRLVAMWEALRQRCEHHCNWYDVRDHLWLRWFYTLKAIICVAMDWNGQAYCKYGIDAVDDVAVWDVSPLGGEYGGEGWTTLAVRRGLLTGWIYEIARDTSV